VCDRFFFNFSLKSVYMNCRHKKNDVCLHPTEFFWVLKYIVFFLFLFSSLPSFSQAPDWLWAKRTGGTSIDYTTDVAADAFGNSYITGTYYSAPITFGSTTLTNSGLTDIFLVKQDAAGNVLWARRAGNTGSDGGYSVATDAAGNVYITGTFSNSVVFGSTTLTSAGGSDIFVAKYDSAGTVLWASRSGSTGGDAAGAIAVSAAGDIYIGGNYTSASIAFGSSTLPNYGYNDAFVAKYNSAGTAVWGKHIGEYLDEFVTSLATDASGNVFVCGVYNSIDVLIGSSVLVVNAQDAVDDIFLAKFSSAGTVLWARGAGGWEGDYAYGVATDAGGNVYMTGYVVSNPSTFGSLSVATGAFALYLAKYNSAGVIQWVASPGFGIGFSVTVDACGDIYWTGDFGGNITIGPTTLTQSGGGDIFVAKYNTSGTALWGMKAGGTNYETGQSITMSAPSNELLVAEYYSSPTLAFGSTTLNSVSVDGFVARIEATCTMAPLPVELLSFSGMNKNGANILNWQTASEINNDYFTIERIRTGKIFETIGTINGAGYSMHTLSYSFIDDSPFNGINYYRLKQTDYNGDVSFSKIIAVTNSPNEINPFTISPDFILVSAEGNIELEILNTLGETIIRPQASKIDISQLPCGIYFIKAKHNNKLITRKFIKQ
jgi:hypothetical protein